MFEHLTIRWIVGILAVALVIYVVSLMFEDGRFILAPTPKQSYVTVQLDSTIARRQLSATPPKVVIDSTLRINLRAMVATVDSDSLKRYDLYRHQQEVVTIDLEEHKEHIFFTWADIKAYFAGVELTFEQLKNKIHNDNH